MLEQLDDGHGIGQLIDALIDREGGYEAFLYGWLANRIGSL